MSRKLKSLSPIERFASQQVTRQEMVDAINLAIRVYEGRKWHNRLRRRINKAKRRTKARFDHWVLSPLYRAGQFILSGVAL